MWRLKVIIKQMPVGLVRKVTWREVQAFSLKKAKISLNLVINHVRSIFFKMADTTSNAINWIDFSNLYYFAIFSLLFTQL